MRTALLRAGIMCAVKVDVDRMLGAFSPLVNERDVELAQNDEIENGILPNAREMERKPGFSGDVIEPHTVVVKNAIVPYLQGTNISNDLRYLSPAIDMELLYAAGEKVGHDCEEGYCGFARKSRGLGRRALMKSMRAHDSARRGRWGEGPYTRARDGPRGR